LFASWFTHTLRPGLGSAARLRTGSRVCAILAVLGGLLIVPRALASWNDPYPETDALKNILYASFRERPKHFDPARSYSSNEYAIIAQIYAPPFN
jgi:hypothetical protein